MSALTALVLFSLLVEYYYTFTPFRVDRLTGVETPSEGAVIYKFTEGSGRSVYSAHGIVAENPATTSLPSVLFLGSSFTQGLEVDDDEKFTSMFEKNWNESHVNGLHAVNAGLGHSNLLIQMNRAAGMKKVYDPVFTFIQISKWELIDKIIAPEFSSWVEIVDGRPVVHTRSPSPPGTDSFFKEILVNFFIDNLRVMLSPIDLNLKNLDIILPIGISFFTFQTMSYTIDIYRRKIEPALNFTEFALFVAFFPQLVAGPIVRAREFLPQLERNIRLSRANMRAGFEIFFIGQIKKVLIADRLSYTEPPSPFTSSCSTGDGQRAAAP